MRILFLLLMPMFACSQNQKMVLDHDYSFLHPDGVLIKLHQSNDTLYELKCYTSRPCQPKPAKHYKVLSFSHRGDFTIVKLEQLDTIQLTADPYPAARYFVLALKEINKKQLGYLILVYGVAKKQVESFQPDLESLKGKFFFTYFSDDYLEELAGLKPIAKKEDALQIMEAAKSDRYKALIERYGKTDTRDIYSAAFAAELLNTVCIDNGYNPVGAGQILGRLMK